MRVAWKNRPSQIEAGSLAPPTFNTPSLVAELLRNRGIESEEAFQNLVSPKLASLSDPRTLAGMERAVERLVQAHQAKEKVCVYADFDLDGSSGLALLYTGMKALGFEQLCYYQPKRLKDGYGFHAFAVEELAEKGVSLIVTVDVGITAVEACARARELGVDVIITDHHQPSEVLPPAFEIVNPNLPHCTSGLGYLSGAGVGFYLLRALRRRLSEVGAVSADAFDLKLVLDFLCIGTITDMVPLVGDNRPLVRAGLRALSQTRKPGLRYLMKELGLERENLTSQEVAIRFSPKLNALSRMEAQILPIHIFLEEDPRRAQEMVQSVMQMNQDRVSHQKAGEDEAFRLLQDWPHQGFVYVHSRNFHRGVLGLLATKLAGTFGKPAFVGAVDEEGSVVGSARWPNGRPGSLLEAMGAAREALIQFGGHHAAAGFELEQSSSPQFVALLAEHFEAQSEGQEAKALEAFFDLRAELEQLDEGLMEWLEAFEPYGTGFQYPIFHVPQVQLLSGSSLRGGHLKFQVGVKGMPHLKWEALWFSPPPAIDLAQFPLGATAELLCEVQRNYFGGRKSIQLLIRDMRLTSQAILMDTDSIAL